MAKTIRDPRIRISSADFKALGLAGEINPSILNSSSIVPAKTAWEPMIKKKNDKIIKLNIFFINTLVHFANKMEDALSKTAL